MVKYSCSAFFQNYVEHINHICDFLFLGFERHRIQRNYIVHRFHGITSQNKSTKSKKL